MEILRVDWENFVGFGQVYITTAHPGVIKAWHFHRHQTDNFCVISGRAKVALYDGREGSPTRGEINEYILGEDNYGRVTIPPMVQHGFMCLGEVDAIVLNLPNRLYNYEEPDELRLPCDTPDIPYDWRAEPK